MAALDRSGISIDAVTAKLVEEGVQLFADAFDKLLGAVARKRASHARREARRPDVSRSPPSSKRRSRSSLNDWRRDGKVRRLWAGDARLWTGSDEAEMAWLARHRRASSAAEIGAYRSFRRRYPKRDGFTHVLLLGMGGSSLGPEVLAETFGAKTASPNLLVLDSTDPRADPNHREQASISARTLFIVSSKSGSTLEPNILKQYFFERVRRAHRRRSSRLAVSSPSPIPARRCRRSPNAIGSGTSSMAIPSIGGRYSVLSDFGMVPAAAMGLDVGKLARPQRRRWCAPAAPMCRRRTIPGVVLGTDPGRRWQRRAATRSPSSPRPALPISARGWSSSWPNRPASRARGSFRSMPSRSGRPRSTARIACSSTCA